MNNMEKVLEVIGQTLNSSIFWSALSAVGTLLAVIVALFLPLYSKHVRKNHIIKILEAEIKDNAETIKQVNADNIPINNGPLKGSVITPLQKNDALLKNIDLNMWLELKYEVATSDPKKFRELQKLNNFVEKLINPIGENGAIRLVNQCTNSEKFNSEFNKIYKK